MKKTLIALVFVLPALFGYEAVRAQKCEVDWNGSRFPAKVLEEKGGKWFIKYDGYGDEWNEWVGADRIHFTWRAGDKLQVLWNGTWFPAMIMEFKDGKYKIHYDNYGDEWNEWVDLKRMKAK